MDVGVPKCAITGCPNKSKMNPTAFKAHLQINNVKYRNQPIPALHQNEPYIYLGTSLVPTLKWKLQIHNTTTKLTKQCQELLTCPATMKQKIKMVDTILRPGVAYSFYAVPYSMPPSKNLTRK